MLNEMAWLTVDVSFIPIGIIGAEVRAWAMQLSRAPSHQACQTLFSWTSHCKQGQRLSLTKVSDRIRTFPCLIPVLT